MTFCPHRSHQSASRRRSANSPTPKLCSERSEKTGTATPAPRHTTSSRNRAPVTIRTESPYASMAGNRRLSPVSQRTILPPASRTTNLYSVMPSMVPPPITTPQRTPSICVIRRTRSTFHSPNWAELPEMPSISPLRRVGASTSTYISPECNRGTAESAWTNTTSENIDV